MKLMYKHHFSFLCCSSRNAPNKQGFMLIELIVATLISSLVAGILLTALSQGSRFQIMIDNVVDMSLRVGVVSNQLEKDLMGAFIPVQAEQTAQEDQEPEEDAGDAKKTDDKKPVAKKPDEKKGPEKKEKIKPLEKIFVSTNKDGNLETLTFITNNPLEVFVGKDVGVVKPKIARVQYSLKPETVDRVAVGGKEKNSYTLHRQESMELELDKSKNVKSYELIGGIKSFTATFTARIEKKQDEKKSDAKVDTQKSAQKEQPKVSYEYKTLPDWVSERKKEEGKEQEFPRIPYSIEIKMVLWDRQENKDKEYTIACEIPVDTKPTKKVEVKQPVDKPKSPDGADKPGGKDNEGPGGQPSIVVHNDGAGKSDVVAVNIMETLTNTLGNLTRIYSQVS